MGQLALSIVGAGIGFALGGPLGARIGFTAGSLIGGLIFQPKGPNTNITLPGPKLPDAQTQTSREGIPIPIIWGLSHVAGNIIQIGPLQEITTTTTTTESAGGGGGKGGGGGGGGTVTTTTTETRRFRTFAIGVCRSSVGKVEGILRIWEYDKLIYDARPVPAISAADHAATAAGLRIHLGGETEVPDPVLEALTGVGNTPAYRGLAYVIFVNKDITEFGSFIPQYRFEVSAGGSVLLTSEPYPVDVTEELDSDNTLVKGHFQYPTVEELGSDLTLQAGELKDQVVDYENDEPEELDSDLTLQAGTLKTALIEYEDDEPEELGSDVTLQAGILKTALIVYDDGDPEELGSDLTLVGGTLG